MQYTSPLTAAGRSLPTAETWLCHITQQLAPFYLTDTALGQPLGNFPTFRSNDGGRFDGIEHYLERDKATWLLPYIGRQYTRMLSRQIFSYGVFFHVTGEERYLHIARAGVDYLRQHLLDREQGGAYSFITEDGQRGPRPAQRTAQDLAYTISGLAFYYYLTRDPEPLAEVLALQAYIFEYYRDTQRNQLVWVRQNTEQDSIEQQELIAHLDQLNAYLLLMLPQLPKSQQARWRADAKWLADVMIHQFMAPQEQRFYGYLHRPEGKAKEARHSDDGHSVKTYWMLYLLGRELADSSLKDLGQKGIKAVLRRAYHVYPRIQLKQYFGDWPGDAPAAGIWNAHRHKTGANWWQYAELDQAAQTLLLAGEPTMKHYLIHTYDSWFRAMVDGQHGEVWSHLNARGSLKNHLWKNGYHAAEHALIGYIGARVAYAQAVPLYFAVPQAQQPASYRPYYFFSDTQDIEIQTLSSGLQRVVFQQLQ